MHVSASAVDNQRADLLKGVVLEQEHALHSVEVLGDLAEGVQHVAVFVAQCVVECGSELVGELHGAQIMTYIDK